jgi:hypothetical protein
MTIYLLFSYNSVFESIQVPSMLVFLLLNFSSNVILLIGLQIQNLLFLYLHFMIAEYYHFLNHDEFVFYYVTLINLLVFISLYMRSYVKEFIFYDRLKMSKIQHPWNQSPYILLIENNKFIYVWLCYYTHIVSSMQSIIEFLINLKVLELQGPQDSNLNLDQV